MRRRDEIVKPSCSFAGFVQHNGQLSIGEKRKNGAPGEALQIEHPIKLLRACPKNRATKSEPIPGSAPPAPLEMDQPLPLTPWPAIVVKIDEEEQKTLKEKLSFLPPRYTPLRVLGEGGMGTVYHCLDVTLDRHVASAPEGASNFSSRAARAASKAAGRPAAPRCAGSRTRAGAGTTPAAVSRSARRC